MMTWCAPSSRPVVLRDVVQHPLGALASYASDPSTSQGRLHPQAAALTRNEFQRDRDRVIHSTAFRRLVYKTQVFIVGVPETTFHPSRSVVIGVVLAGSDCLMTVCIFMFSTNCSSAFFIYVIEWHRMGLCCDFTMRWAIHCQFGFIIRTIDGQTRYCQIGFI